MGNCINEEVLDWKIKEINRKFEQISNSYKTLAEC